MTLQTVDELDILLVEDNPGDVRLTQEALRDGRLHNRLHVARDGEEAMNFLRRGAGKRDSPRPDLVLLDLNLPKMDGREVLREIKEDPALRSIPVVVLTTSQADEDVIRSYDLHANFYVTKPVDLHRFIEVVRRLDDCWLSIVRLPPKEGHRREGEEEVAPAAPGGPGNA